MAARALGVSVVPLETRRDALIATARTADRLGYRAFYQNETWAYDATLLLAEMAMRTERLRIATGILGGFTTFSSFSLDVWRLVTEPGGGGALALGYIAASVLLSIGALFLGLLVDLFDVLETQP